MATRIQKFKRRLMWLGLLLIALVVAAPTIVSQTSLHNSLLATALPSGWRIESEQAALGWMSSQTLRGVTIADAEGKPLFTAESVTLPRALLTLALSQHDLGKIALVRPTLYVETRPHTSNWEDFFATLQPQAEQASSDSARVAAQPRTQLLLEITAGTVFGIDTVTGQQWALRDVNLTADVGASTRVQGSAQLATQQPPREGLVKFHYRPTDDGQRRLELLAERLPLEPLRPWLARVLPGARLAGLLSADSQATWRVDAARGLLLDTTGRLEVKQLDLTADALRGDRLQCQRLNAPWNLSLDNDMLAVEQLAVEADWAQLSATGTVALTELQAFNLRNLPQRTTHLAGTVDVAQLAAMLPRTLQLREGVRIDAGQLSIDAGGQPQGEQFAWDVAATVQNVAGSDGQRDIRWEKPIEATARLRATPLGPQLEQLDLNAPFATATVKTQQEAINGEFDFDLAQFTQELSQFVDMQAWQLRGLGEGTLTLARQPNQQFAVEAKMDLTDLRVAEHGHEIWAEPKLRIGLQAEGTEQDLTPSALARGKLVVHGARDALSIQLLQPVDLREPRQPWDLQVEGNGPLASWAGRLRPWLAKAPRRLEGDAHVQARFLVAASGAEKGYAVEVTDAQGSVVELRVEADKLSIDEPRVEFTGDARWDPATESVVSRQLQLLGSSFSFRARDVAVALAGQNAPMARGNMAFSANLERIAAAAGWVGQTSSTWPRGKAVGQVQLTSNADQVQADFGVKIEQLQLVRTTAAAGAVYGRPEVVWTEPALELTGAAKYLTATDRAEFDNLQVNGNTLRLKSSASVDQLGSIGQLRASGLLEYDPRELAKLVASYTGGGVQLQGDQQVRFQVAGPLFTDAETDWTHRWDATAEAGWSSAGAFGLPLGGGRLRGTMRDGQLEIAPLDVAVGQGRLTAAPRVFLSHGSQQLVLPKGPLISNVAISPEVSETMLKYVAPILAGATRAEGEFSVDLDQADIPLRHPKTGRVQGRLAVHRLHVSPGPMVAQLATLIRQIESLSKRKEFLQAATGTGGKAFLTVSERQIDFQIVEGRVYHRNLEFLIDGVPVRSYGSVGFDQTLALMIEVPFQDKWIEREPALRGFAGQSIQLPIQGTFQKPRIDQRAVAQLSTQLLQGAATQAIGNELNRQLEKLFRGK